MRRAVIFGAGNIGRGFIGHLLSKSGFHIVFVDVNAQLVNTINELGRYPVELVNNEYVETDYVCDVSAINGTEVNRVAEEISSADIIATAVGVNNLSKIAPALAKGLAYRIDNYAEPVNCLVCENKIGANRLLAEIIAQLLPEEQRLVLDEKVGFVEVSVGRMVPAAENTTGHPLLLRVEPYDKLPFDKTCCRGRAIDICGGVPCENFAYYIRHKLFIHNLGHAVTAYLGFLKGYKYVHEAASDLAVRDVARAAMRESARALILEFPENSVRIEDDISDLLRRFGNTALRDPINRVCADPLRKLGPFDRLVGSVQNCSKWGIDCPNIHVGIGAALLYDNKQDIGSVEMQKQIAEEGVIGFLQRHCKMSDKQNSAIMPILAAHTAFSTILA